MEHDLRIALKHRSLVDIDEANLLKRLLANPLDRESLLNIKGIESDSDVLTSVPLAGLPGEPKGDIDILLVPPGRPDMATAIEVKRIKAGPTALRSLRPNKLQKYATKAVRQANLLARIGFSQVYLWPFVVVDSRERNAGRNTFEGLPSDMHCAIRDALTVNGLDPRIGLIRHERVQPMDYEPLTTGTGGMELERLATAIEQPAGVTAWVAAAVGPGRGERS